MNYYTNQLFAGNSPIAGKGLFTSAAINTNEIIMIISGDVITGEECERRENEENNVYIFWNGDDCYIDTVNTTLIKYINHSCKPNCYVADRDEESLFLCAAREIAPGEELTIDYDYEEIYEYCGCGNCK